MATLDKNPITEIKTDGSYTTVEKVMVVDKEKIRRHDEEHKKDMKLAASLQAHWASRVNAEHRPN